MKPDIAQKLIAALESGEFKHCKLRLRINDCNCVIGVLCELYRRETGDGVWKAHWDELDAFQFYGEQDFLPEIAGAPDSVMEWSGMKSPTGMIDGTNLSLANANDAADDYSAAIEFLKQHAEEI